MEELVHSPWALFTAVAGAVILVRNVFAALIDLIKWYKTPNATQDKRIEALEKTTAELQQEAKRLHERLDNNDGGQVILFKAISALLGHGIDGNNDKEMREAKQEMQNYLFRK